MDNWFNDNKSDDTLLYLLNESVLMKLEALGREETYRTPVYPTDTPTIH